MQRHLVGSRPSFLLDALFALFGKMGEDDHASSGPNPSLQRENPADGIHHHGSSGEPRRMQPTGRAAAHDIADEVGNKVHSLPTIGDTVPIPKVRLPPVPFSRMPTPAADAKQQVFKLVAPHVDDLAMPEALDVV